MPPEKRHTARPSVPTGNPPAPARRWDEDVHPLRADVNAERQVGVREIDLQALVVLGEDPLCHVQIELGRDHGERLVRAPGLDPKGNLVRAWASLELLSEHPQGDLRDRVGVGRHTVRRRDRGDAEDVLEPARDVAGAAGGNHRELAVPALHLDALEVIQRLAHVLPELALEDRTVPTLEPELAVAGHDDLGVVSAPSSADRVAHRGAPSSV